MKKALFIAFTLMFLVGFSVYKSVSVSSSSQNPLIWTNPEVYSTCTQEPARSEVISDSTLTDIRRLADYDNICRSMSTDMLTIISHIPLSEQDAISNSTKLAKDLEELAKYKLHPLILFSYPPTAGQTNLTEFLSEKLDDYLSIYYKNLFEKGIDQVEIGTLVFAPLPNLPYYGGANLKPSDFAKVYNRNLGSIRKYYPNFTPSILLSTSTYESPGFSRADGEYLPLLPYLEGISPSSIASLGFEGLPDDSMIAVLEFLNPPSVMETLMQAGVKNIWFRTGTYAAINPVDPISSAYLPVDIRQQMLNQIRDIAGFYKSEGYTVSVNLIAFDETPSNPAGTDWSYFGSNYTNNILHSKMLTDFITSIHASEIELSLQLSN